MVYGVLFIDILHCVSPRLRIIFWHQITLFTHILKNFKQNCSRAPLGGQITTSKLDPPNSFYAQASPSPFSQQTLSSVGLLFLILSFGEFAPIWALEVFQAPMVSFRSSLLFLFSWFLFELRGHLKNQTPNRLLRYSQTLQRKQLLRQMASKQKAAASRELLAGRPRGSGEAEAANVEEAQEEENSNFRRNGTMNQRTNLSAHTSGSQGCWGENLPQI